MSGIYTIKRTTEPLGEIISFYESQGYYGGAKEEDVILLTKENDELICVLRIAVESNIPVLRGMFLREDKRGNGLGKKILKEIEPLLHEYMKTSYCIPKSHLESFYALIGFKKINPSEAPSFLKERINGYLHEGYDVILMERAP